MHHSIVELQMNPKHAYAFKPQCHIINFQVLKWLSFVFSESAPTISATEQPTISFFFFHLCFCPKIASEPISEHLIFQISWGSMPPTPPPPTFFTIIKGYTYLCNLPSENFDYGSGNIHVSEYLWFNTLLNKERFTRTNLQFACISKHYKGIYHWSSALNNDMQ